MIERDIIIDTDPGVDDTLALIYTHQRSDSSVKLTTTFGNSSLDNVTRNAGYIVKKLGTDWPIYKGASGPTFGSARVARSHGQSGFGGFEPGDSDIQAPEAKSAAELFVDTAKSPDKQALLCLGPLTNVAMAIQENPGFLNSVSQLIIMGGAFTKHGNVTDLAEFNVYNDPKAFKTVTEVAVKNSVDTTIIPAEVCRKVMLTKYDLKSLESHLQFPNIRQIVEPFIDFYMQKSYFGGYEGAVLYDALVPMYCEYPRLFKTENAIVSTSMAADATYGQTVYVPNAESSLKVCTNIYACAAKDLVMETLLEPRLST